MKKDKNTKRIELLVVDEELLIRDLLYEFFTAQGFKVHLARDYRNALEILDHIDFQIALIDLNRSRDHYLELAGKINELKPYAPVVVMTAHPSTDSAIQSMRNGVLDYIVKPFKIEDVYEIMMKAYDEHIIRMKRGYKPLIPGAKRESVNR